MKILTIIFSTIIPLLLFAFTYTALNIFQPQGVFTTMEEISPVMKTYDNGGSICTSVYIVTNQSPSAGVYVHEFYNGSEQFVYSFSDYNIGVEGESEVYDMKDYNAPAGYMGKVVISSDQPFSVTLDPCPERPTYEISGRVLDANQSPVEGITVTLDSGEQTVSNANGIYIFDAVEAGNYRIAPSFTGLSFSPSYRDVTIPPEAQNRDFELATSLISGVVRDENNNPIPSVRVITDKGHEIFTNSEGKYQFSNLSAGTYVVTAIASGYDLVPPSQSIIVPPIAWDVNFFEGQAVYLPMIIK